MGMVAPYYLKFNYMNKLKHLKNPKVDAYFLAYVCGYGLHVAPQSLQNNALAV